MYSDESKAIGDWIKSTIGPDRAPHHGEIIFEGRCSKRKTLAQYVNITEGDVPPDVLHELLASIWIKRQPSFAIFVVSGDDDGELQEEIETKLASGLQKISQSGVWVITNGLNMGITKLIGETLHGTKSSTIGINSLCRLSYKSSLSEEQTSGRYKYPVPRSLVEQGLFLDHKHRCFLLLGSVSSNEKMSETCAALEAYIIDTLKIPSVFLISGGGLDTMKPACDVILRNKHVPVVIVKGTGGLSDCLSYGLENAENEKTDERVEARCTGLAEIIKKQFPLASKEASRELYTQIEMIEIYDVASDVTIDDVILKAIFNHLARRKMISAKHTWKTEDFENVMMLALSLNKVNFVKLLSKSIDMQSFLTKERLEFLYGYRSNGYLFNTEDHKNIVSPEEFINWLPKPAPMAQFKSVGRSSTVKLVNTLCTRLVRDDLEGFIEDLSVIENRASAIVCMPTLTFKYPFNELFFWAVLNGMSDMALYFWEFEEEKIIKALIACEMCNSLSNMSGITSRSFKKKFCQHAKFYHNLALSLLNSCFEKDERKTIQLITCESNQFQNCTCLNLALSSNNFEFRAHDSVQLLLNHIWTGSIKQERISILDGLLGMICPVYVCYAFEFDDMKFLPERYADTHVNGRQGQLPNVVVKKNGTQFHWTKKLKEFYLKTPAIKFYSNVLSFIVFLSLFSYTAILKKTQQRPTAIEYIVLIYVISFTVDNIHQILRRDAKMIRQRLQDSASKLGNIVEGSAIVTFFLAFLLRLSDSTEEAGTLLYAFNVALWILRLLNAFYGHEVLGPYVVMIYKMLADMSYFLLILLVVLLAFGVSTTAILKPQTSGWNMLRDVTFHPYFHIYGELFNDRDADPYGYVTRFGTKVQNSYAEPIAWVLLAIYLLIANVLLLNILIAIFNNTYSTIQKDSVRVSTLVKYHIIMDYANRPPVIQPFTLVWHLAVFVKWILWQDAYPAKASISLRTVLTEDEKEMCNGLEADCAEELLSERYENHSI